MLTTRPPNIRIGIKTIGSRFAAAFPVLHKTPKSIPKRYPSKAMRRYIPTDLGNVYQIE